jgi:hypothetical protein
MIPDIGVAVFACPFSVNDIVKVMLCVYCNAFCKSFVYKTLPFVVVCLFVLMIHIQGHKLVILFQMSKDSVFVRCREN